MINCTFRPRNIFDFCCGVIALFELVKKKSRMCQRTNYHDSTTASTAFVTWNTYRKLTRTSQIMQNLWLVLVSWTHTPSHTHAYRHTIFLSVYAYTHITFFSLWFLVWHSTRNFIKLARMRTFLSITLHSALVPLNQTMQV